MAGVRIDALPTTSIPSKEHEFPSMKDGLSVKLTVGQIGEALKNEPETWQNKTIVQPELTLKQSATPAPTASGDIRFGTTNKVIEVGDGGATKTFVPIPAGTVAGDLEYFTSAKAKGRLALGAARTTLRVNAAGNGLEYGGGNGPPDAVLEAQFASGTNGGTATSGSWQTRPLNTEVRDPGGLVTLSSNQFVATVDGWAQWETINYSVGLYKTRLRNVTDNVVVGVGAAGAAPSGTNVTSTSFGGAPILAGKTYVLEQQVGTTAANIGMGVAVGFSTTEVYARVQIWRG